MTNKDFKDYMLNLNFTETERNTFTKDYEGGIEVVYKINKDIINVYYKTHNRKIKRMKARLKNLNITTDGSLSGFKTIL